MRISPAGPADEEAMLPSSWAELCGDDIACPDALDALDGYVEEEEGEEGDVQARREREQVELAAERQAREEGVDVGMLSEAQAEAVDSMVAAVLARALQSRHAEPAPSDGDVAG
jgi:hypothetical protein